MTKSFFTIPILALSLIGRLLDALITSIAKSFFSIALLTFLLIGRPFPAACDPTNAAGPVGTVAAPAMPGKSVTTGKWKIIPPEKIAWRPTNLLPPGAQIAVLEGDPSKQGFFTLRLKVPDGYHFPAHWHASAERVTVLSGTLYLGMGDGSNKAAAVPLGPGTYSTMPSKMAHFGWTQGETILQLSSLGPWTITYLNPSDDPRR
jgi:hypothetical protein